MEMARGGALEERFSPAVIRFYWVCFTSLHMAGFIYYAFSAWCYWNLPGTRLDVWLSLYDLGIGTEYDRIITLFMGVISVVHGIYLVWMIAWSFKKKQLVFAVYNVFQMPKCILRFAVVRRGSRSVYPNGISSVVYRALFTRDGLLGVDGPYFDIILFCREIVETALQTHQAYRMSLLLPRVMVNRGYVALLVVNCWTIALVHSIFQRNSTKRRVWSLVSDCVLDMVTSMGISMVLLATYISDFNFETSGFPPHKWYEDVWVVNAMSEFQMILVTSWKDMCMRMIFALSLLGDMDNMKMAMRARRRKGSNVTADSKQQGNRATMIAPYCASTKSRKGPSLSLVKKKRPKDALTKLSQYLFFGWGLAILTLHLYAETTPHLPQCWMQVRPWVTTQSSCSLLVLDCHQNQLSGTKKEVSEQWSSFDPTSVTRVVIRHCPVLELPERLTTFSSLNAVKVYNTTIVLWESSAALTQANHPNLMTLLIVRVVFPNGELPVGLQSIDFPQSAKDIEFCTTNLRDLPDDLDLKWPQQASIYIEASQLREVPECLVRLAPLDLSLSMNPITTLPAQLFQQDTTAYLSFGGTLVSQLPETITNFSSMLCEVNLSYTNMSFLWPWIDSIVSQSSHQPILLATTPYCQDLERIIAGQQTNFTTFPPESREYADLSVFSDASASNWATLTRGVSCEDQAKTWYPIDFEDKYSSVSYPVE
ncbi:Centrosomal protein of 41 kDa [Phytophthora pseudosyringae]|uniref:Centrosomal protein of 41 kDa n=1 Tax=Phytophthora pseudosyringae TaxID=221518 RepID=A0A8T1VUE6_9STRA|nr:Centrosomal protein of 41 kDa [Phytophthora pseudosyringae]